MSAFLKSGHGASSVCSAFPVVGMKAELSVKSILSGKCHDHVGLVGFSKYPLLVVGQIVCPLLKRGLAAKMRFWEPQSSRQRLKSVIWGVELCQIEIYVHVS